MRYSTSVIALAVLGGTAAAETQNASDKASEATLAPVTVSATRTSTEASELTRSVTVITREELERQGRMSSSVGEILAHEVPGFSPSTEALTDFGQTLRGRTFLTLIDGVPQSTPLRDGRRSLNTISADVIERIEVVRGGTAIYGFGAAGGLVNIITRKPEPGDFNAHSEAGVAFSTTHSSDSERWRANQRVSGDTGALDYVLSGSYVKRNGFFDDEGNRIPADPFGVQGGLADTDEWNVLAKLGFEPEGGQQRLGLTINHFDIFQDSNFAGLGTGDPDEREKTPAVRGNINPKEPGTESTIVNMEYRHGDVLGSALNSQIYYGDLLTRFGKFPGFPQVQVVSEKVGARFTFDTPARLGGTDFDVTWGADYLNDETDQEGIDGTSGTPRMDQDAFAGFVQLAIPVGDRALIRTGVRHEDISVDVADVVNRNSIFVQGGTLEFDETLFNLTGAYYLTDQVELFGGYSQGFSLADIGRAIADSTATRAETLESDAQKADNYELGIRRLGDRWSGSLTAFFSESDNGTTFDANLNIAKQPEEIYGVELEGDFRISELLRLGGTASWIEGEVDLDDDGDFEDDLPSTRVPPLKVTAFAEYSPAGPWSTRLQGLYSGNRDPDSTQFGSGDVEDYVVFDWHNRIDLAVGRLDVSVENLLNEDYFPVLNQAGALPFGFSRAPGRTLALDYSLDW